MEGSRILSLLLALSGLSAATASLVDEAEQHGLYGRALEERELGRACYSGHYDADHLRTHPK